MPRINPGKKQPKLHPDLKTLKRLLGHVELDDSGCWIWQKYKDPDGYGQVKIAGKRLSAHRVFYSIFKRSIAEGDEVDHICENPACCNPMHLKRCLPDYNRAQGGRNSRKNITDDDLPPF